MHRLVTFGLLLSTLLPAWPTRAVEVPMPVGVDFLVNSGTTLAQEEPAVAVAIDGSFLIVWSSGSSAGSDTDSRSIQGRFYDPLALPRGNDLQINSKIEGDQKEPSVARLPTGEFVAVWADLDPIDPAIRGRFLAADGSLHGEEFLVGRAASGLATSPEVAAVGAAGQFVVVWKSNSGGQTTIHTQRMAADGSPLGEDLLSGEALDQEPAVGSDQAGNFVVAWWQPEAGHAEIVARRHAPDGTVLWGPHKPLCGRPPLPTRHGDAA